MFGLVVVFALPAVLLAVEVLAALVSASLMRAVHLVFVAALAGTLVIQVLRRSADLTSTEALIALAAAAGVAVAFLYAAFKPVRSLLSVLALAPLAFLANFLFVSPVSALTLAEKQDVVLPSVEARSPVVMIVFDEFPTSSILDSKGEVDAGRFPNIAELAQESTWFRNATTVSDSTNRAVPAILTGILPEVGRAPIFAFHPRSIFTLLGGDYRMNVAESSTHLCPPEVCQAPQPAEPAAQPAPEPVTLPAEEPASLYSDVGVVYLHLVAPPRLAETLPPITDQWMNFGREEEEAQDVLEEALEEVEKKPSATTEVVPKFRSDRRFHTSKLRMWDEFLRRIRLGAVPSLNLIHIWLPHGPWSFFPSGRQSSIAGVPAPGRASEGDRWVERPLALQAYQRHLLQAGFVDRLVGQLLDRLERTGVADEAAVVVTADHGISFRPGESRRGATTGNAEDIAFVPLFVKSPGQKKGAVVDYHVETIDILPTLADLLDIRIPWAVDGRTALSDPKRPYVVLEGGEVKVPFSSLVRRHEVQARERARLLGSADWESVFRVGPHDDLLGRSVSEFAVVPSTDSATIDDELTRRLLGAMPPGFHFVPSPLVGVLAGAGAVPGQSLAVAVNGRIAAVASTYQRSGTVRFTALAPESAFRTGRNRVTFYWVDEPEGQVRQLAQLVSG